MKRDDQIPSRRFGNSKKSEGNNQCEEIIEDINEILQIILWNNKPIRIDGKPVFYKTLAGNRRSYF